MNEKARTEDASNELTSSRRRFLRQGAVASVLSTVGATSLASAANANASASPPESAGPPTAGPTTTPTPTDEQGRAIVDGGAEKVDETDSVEAFVTTIKKEDREHGGGESILTHRFIERPKATEGDVTMFEVNRGTMLQLRKRGLDALHGKRPMTDGGERFVERQMGVYAPCGGCHVTGQTHYFHGGTIEFRQAVNDYAIGTVTSLALTFMTSVTGGTATAVAGLVALVSTFDSFTIGGAELDTNWNTSPKYGPVIAGGWNVTRESNWVYEGGSLNWGHPY